jgi:hypothetical protein
MGGDNMKNPNISIVLCCIFLTSLMFSQIPIELNPFLIRASAENKEFDAEIFNENISIPSENFKTAIFNLKEGEEFEIIYTLQVKENLPINIWFVNEDNYLLLMSDVNFLYFIDGSDQEVSYTKKIVSLKEVGIYKLVMINSNNQTVNVNLISEIRTFSSDSGETSSEDLSFFFYPLVIAVIILVALLAVLLFKGHMNKKDMKKITNKSSSKKKGKKHKPKKSKDKVPDDKSGERKKTHKVKKAEPKISDEETSKVLKNIVPKDNEPVVSEKVSSRFCGDCGEAVNTTYCKNCGRKV